MINYKTFNARIILRKQLRESEYMSTESLHSFNSLLIRGMGEVEHKTVLLNGGYRGVMHTRGNLYGTLKLSLILIRHLKWKRQYLS